MKKITIIGAGTMGKIFLTACREIFSDTKITATTKSGESVQKLQQEFFNIEILTDNQQAIKNSDLIFLACKPQNFLEIAKEIESVLKKDALVMSVMAGVTLETIQTELGVKRVIRTMPNLCARVGKSMTAWIASPEVSGEDKRLIKKLLNAIGKELEFDNDDEIDKVTAIAGSGPGFFFVIIEEWLRAIEQIGFSKEQSSELLLQTVNGANNLLQSDKDVAKLRKQVTSKGGTTEAGLEVLQGKDLKNIFVEVLQIAYNRAKGLSE